MHKITKINASLVTCSFSAADLVYTFRSLWAFSFVISGSESWRFQQLCQIFWIITTTNCLHRSSHTVLQMNGSFTVTLHGRSSWKPHAVIPVQMLVVRESASQSGHRFSLQKHGSGCLQPKKPPSSIPSSVNVAPTLPPSSYTVCRKWLTEKRSKAADRINILPQDPTPSGYTAPLPLFTDWLLPPPPQHTHCHHMRHWPTLQTVCVCLSVCAWGIKRWWR